MMKFSYTHLVLLSVCFLPLIATQAMGVSPFSEGFDNNSSNWLDVASQPLDYFNTDGNPNGYVSDTISVDENTGTVFRGHNLFDASNDAFVGDWQAAGIHTFSFDIRHNHSDPISFFARIATSGNFPAHTAQNSNLVNPNAWTTVSFDVSQGSSEIAPEFGSYATTFGSVGNIQIGPGIANNFPTQTITFDVDNISIVPEPTALLMVALGLLSIFSVRGHRSYNN